MNNFNITNSQYSEIQIWSGFNNKITKFRNNCNIVIFNNIFNSESERLLTHYILDCNRDFNTFLTYLTTEQCNNLFIYIVNIDL